MSIRAQAERIGFQIVGELTRCIEREPTHLYQCYFDEAMKLNGNLKKQVEETTNKESLIEQAGMPLTDDELNMVSGGNLIPRVFRCGSCNSEGPYGLACACGGRYDVAIR